MTIGTADKIPATNAVNSTADDGSSIGSLSENNKE